MKRASKILAISFLILLALLLCSCQEAETDNIIPPSNQPTETELRTPEYDENGKYIGFSDIPDNYTVNDAINDGCIVIEIEGAGRFAMAVKDHQASLEETNEPADMVMTPLKAVEFFFSPYTAMLCTSPMLKSWLPVPFGMYPADEF